MANPFGTDEMAAGYATSRPAVHPLVLDRAYKRLGRLVPFTRALDVGCGAGVSTRALTAIAMHCIGLEPAEAMLKWISTIAPSADFVVGSAESLPLNDGTVDLITAAGSLNYANLVLFFPEAARVLTEQGVLIVYDFSPGKSFRNAPALDEWFSSFYVRYPPPKNEGQALNPAILENLALGFLMRSHEAFEIGLTLTPDFYLDYMLTETNVASAVRSGVPLSEVRSWCSDTLTPVWKGAEHEVLFRGYFACLTLA